MKPKMTLRKFFSFYFGIIGFATGCIPLSVFSVILNLKPSNVIGNTVSILGKKALSPALSSISPIAGFLISSSNIFDDDEEANNKSYKPRDFGYDTINTPLLNPYKEDTFNANKSLFDSINKNNENTLKFLDYLKENTDKETTWKLNNLNKM